MITHNKENDKNYEFVKNLLLEKCNEVHLTGGAVRDSILGIEPNDYDFCVTEITIDELLELFEPHAYLVRRNILLPNTSIRIFYNDYSNIDIDVRNSTSTIGEFLYKNDYTINTCAMKLPSHSILSFYNGENDIHSKILKLIDGVNTIRRDPIRILRAGKFKSKCKLTIDEETYRVLVENKQLVFSCVPLDTRMKSLHNIYRTCREHVESINQFFKEIGIYEELKSEYDKFFAENFA